MTYDTSKEAVGNYPLTVCELKLDACSREYGNSYTNLITYSSQYDHANWINGGTPVIVGNAANSPDGEIGADYINDDNAYNTLVSLGYIN